MFIFLAGLVSGVLIGWGIWGYRHIGKVVVERIAVQEAFALIDEQKADIESLNKSIDKRIDAWKFETNKVDALQKELIELKRRGGNASDL